MDTRQEGCLIKKTITSKIVLSYILIIVSALVITGLVFAVLARFYTERQVRIKLLNDANVIHDIISAETDDASTVLNANTLQAIRKKLITKAGSLESSFALVSKDLKVLYPRNEEGENFKQNIFPLIRDNFDPKARRAITVKVHIDGVKYLFALLPPKGNVSQGLRNWIVLYSAVEPVQQMMRSILIVLMVALIISACIAAAAGIFMARGIARPIIQLKNRAAALSRREFDGKVDIRTGDELEELGNTVNRMARDLKEYDIAQKRFFQNASHELKTPLMSIQGYAEGIKDGVFENNGEALDIIVEESKRLKGIVEELIYLSKIETQQDFYKFAPDSMNDVIEQSIEKLKGVSLKSNIRINAVLYKDVRLSMDRDKMIQALINVLGNGIRYARNEINVVTANTGRTFELVVSDDGEGFDGIDPAKVFERFSKGKKGNSGLGLAITKAIVEKHGGTITASSHPGHGAEFRIVLPIPG